jgi:hypothetical protein
MSVVQGLLGDFAVTVTPATLEPTIGENWLVITRNGVTVFRLMVGTSLAPVTFLDTGLTPENSYQYEAFILNLGETWGVSGPKLRSVTSNPPVVTTPQFTVGPVARLIGGVVQVYIEGTTGVVGADRMAVVKSFDQTNTTTFGISSGLTPFIATDTDTAMKWYKLVAFSSTDPLVWGESPWRWWSGVPVTGSQGTDPPTFIDGTPKREMRGG